MIKWENVSLLTMIIILSIKVVNFGKYVYKTDILVHYLLINLLLILAYRFYKIIKKEVVAPAKSLTTSKKTTQR